VSYSLFICPTKFILLCHDSADSKANLPAGGVQASSNVIGVTDSCDTNKLKYVSVPTTYH
jgi:hypothetical protein